MADRFHFLVVFLLHFRYTGMKMRGECIYEEHKVAFVRLRRNAATKR